MKLYKYATVRCDYSAESELLKRFLTDDSVRVAILSRELNDEEKSQFESQKIIPRTTHVATDAVALVVNPANPDTQLVYSRLADLFKGTVHTWNQFSGHGLKDSIRIVFDKNGSSNARFLKDQFIGKGSFPSVCYAVNSNKEVIDYVSKTKGAIGIIGVNWISDRQDPEVEQFLGNVKVVALSASDDSVGVEYYQPLQAYIALKKYPLTRKLYIISREGRNGLGTGFASFFAGDAGQRIVRLSGMLPATMPVRIINIHQ
jgi:phosphate transport system substrate-binding protein